MTVRSLPQLLLESVSRFPDHVALTEEGRGVSYEDLWERCGRLAGALAASGVRSGDRVALMLPNGVDYVVSFFAVARAGAVVAQVDPLSARRELEHVLSDSEATALLVGPDTYARVRGFDAPASLRTTMIGGAPGSAPDPPDVAIDPARDLAVIQYTGGTTGRPRGACHTHASLLGAVTQTISLLIEDVDALPPNAKSIAVAPLFHIFGTTMVLLLGFELGWNLLLMPRFDLAHMLELIRREQPAMLAAVPAIYAALDARPDLERHGLDRVQLFVSGGAPVPPALAQRFEARTGRPIWEGYGLSEAAPVTFNTYVAGPRSGQHRRPRSRDRGPARRRRDRHARRAAPGSRRAAGARPSGHAGLLEAADRDGRCAQRRMAVDRRCRAHDRVRRPGARRSHEGDDQRRRSQGVPA
jgi:long-chain acyl-CoA synthetase